ncbi:peptidoglycan recognition protein long class isoform B [Anopheles sinensis]|uniref:Peptidoglycan recognition protein long class isoform B n=1 Tax=Anopheles sinensis TaxID=74873 RepID=A0A084WKV1_ANOSI|nr:peptidoglycan recognition protein long class isoform B [Anopheles sinensis]
MAKAKIPPPANEGQAPPETITTQPPNGDEMLTEGAQNASTVTSTTDSTRGSLSNISTPSIKRGDNDGDDDSSAFDSSSDTECDDDSIKRAIDRIPGALAPGEACVLQNGALVVGPEALNPRLRSPQHVPTAGAPSIGSIALQNSSDITFGNKTYIKGQVVIKNIYKDRGNGLANDGYQVHENDATDSASGKKVPPAASPPEPRTWQSSLKSIIKDKPLLSFIVMISLMIVLCAIIAVISILTASEDDLFSEPRPLRLVTRQEWLAQPPREDLAELKLPVSNVIIAHTATESCTTQQACITRVKSIQNYHMATLKYSDIGYNFLIGGDGAVYEGRGWLKVGAHTRDYNFISYGIAFIGNFEVDQPTDSQMEQLDALLHNCTARSSLASNYQLYGASQLRQTVSPGKFLMEKLKLLPHFSVEKPRRG